MAVKNVILGIVIIILTISVVVYGVNTFYERPQYNDYCENYRIASPLNPVDCAAANGKWTSYEGIQPTGGVIEGRCDVNFYCSEDYSDARESYARNVFLIVLPLGILIIILSAAFLGLETVGAGLMGGGAGVVLYGVGEYWSYSANLLRFLLSLVGLGVVVWFTYWLNKKSGEKK